MCRGQVLESDGNIILCRTDLRGKCIVAARDFKAGDVIFKCPVIVFQNWQDVEATELKDYYYLYDENRDLCCFVTGMACFLNHSSHPNAVKSFDFEKELFVCSAAVDIAKNEEILIKYKKVWFSEIPAEPIEIAAA
jgi:hypothetical protein